MMIVHVCSLRSPPLDFVSFQYIDDLDIIGNEKDINDACHHLKTEFEMKDLSQTKFCLGICNILETNNFLNLKFIFSGTRI